MSRLDLCGVMKFHSHDELFRTNVWLQVPWHRWRSEAVHRSMHSVPCILPVEREVLRVQRTPAPDRVSTIIVTGEYDYVHTLDQDAHSQGRGLVEQHQRLRERHHFQFESSCLTYTLSHKYFSHGLCKDTRYLVRDDFGTTLLRNSVCSSMQSKFILHCKQCGQGREDRSITSRLISNHLGFWC